MAMSAATASTVDGGDAGRRSRNVDPHDETVALPKKSRSQ